MTGKHHVNPETGQSGKCGAGTGAKARGCPFGGESGTENHYETEQEANAAAQVVLQEKYGELPSGMKKSDPAPKVEETGPKEVVEGDKTFMVNGKHRFEIPTTRKIEGYMGHPGYMGSKRSEKGYVSPKDIAKNIREDLKQATLAGYLPKGLKYGVTSPDNSVDVKIKGLGKDRDIYDYDPHTSYRKVTLKPEIKEIVNKVEAIHKSYNYNAGNFQYDYSDSGFYGQAKELSENDEAFYATESARGKLNRVISAKKKTGMAKSEIAEDKEFIEAEKSYYNVLENYYRTRKAQNLTYDYYENKGIQPDWEEIDRQSEITSKREIQWVMDKRGKNASTVGYF